MVTLWFLQRIIIFIKKIFFFFFFGGGGGGGMDSPHKGSVIQKAFSISWHHHLSSTLPEIGPDTVYVVCISVSLGFRQKPSDTALLSIIALTTFNCIVSASVTKGVLLCFVVTVHWWRHRTHYNVTEAYRTLRDILTVHLNNGATRADLRGIPKHCEVTADNIYGWFWCDFLYH